MSALANKRGHTDGAAFFSTIPRARDATLLRLLVAYEIVWDFLDSVNESGAEAGQANGRQLHVALIDALDPRRAIHDHYRHHPWRDDGGYLRALVATCRCCVSRLPAYERVRPLLIGEAARAQVLAINHELRVAHRDATLREWAEREFPAGGDATWFELTGAASASLTVHALLALCATAGRSSTDDAQTRRAYFPWISVATTMLDSYVDQIEDASHGDHSYVAHYPNSECGARRVAQLIDRALREAGSLHRGERHVLIVACMAAMYLSKDSAHCDALCATTRLLVASGGSLTRALCPILRLWRIVYGQRSA